MARIVIKNLTASNIALPYPVSRSIKPGQELTMDGVDAELYKTSEPLDILIKSSKITLSIKEDPNISDVLETEPLADMANEAISLVGGGGGGGGVTKTATNLAFPIDYDNGTDPDAGVVFQNQTEIDDYLITHSITHFKHVQACWEATPVHLVHDIFFNLVAGTHRPRNPEPAPFAWCFTSYGDFPKVMHPGAAVYVSGENVNVGNWNVIVASQTVASYDNLNADPKIQVSGTPFVAGALKGYFARYDSSPNAVYVIHNNTTDTIYLSENVSGAPTSVEILSPATIMRNSYNDTTIAKNDSALFFSNPQSDDTDGQEGGEGRVTNIRVDNFGVRAGIEIQNGMGFTFSQSLIDQAGLKDSGITWYGRGIDSRNGSKISWYKSSFRGRYIASTPSGDSSPAIALGGSMPHNFAGTIERGYIGGSGGAGGCVDIYNSWIRFASGVIGDCGANAIRASNSWIDIQTTTNTKRTTFRGAHGTAIDLVANCIMPPSQSTNSVGEISCTFESLDSDAILVGPNCVVRLGDVKDAGVPLTAHVVRVLGPFSKVYASISTTASGAQGDVRYSEDTDHKDITWDNIKARKKCITQPEVGLKGYVEILSVEDGSASGLGYLNFASPANTLRWAEKGDVNGPTVVVTGGGIFTLASTNGKRVRVLVDPTLPGGSVSDSVIIGHRPLEGVSSIVEKQF